MCLFIEHVLPFYGDMHSDLIIFTLNAVLVLIIL